MIKMTHTDIDPHYGTTAKQKQKYNAATTQAQWQQKTKTKSHYLFQDPEIGARLHGLGTGDLIPIDMTHLPNR